MVVIKTAMKFFPTFIFLFFRFLAYIQAIDLNVCFLIDAIRDAPKQQYSVEEKLSLAQAISRCLVAKNPQCEIATVIYDNHSARLEFDFKSIKGDDYDGFSNIMSSTATRTNVEESRNISPTSWSNKRTLLRIFAHSKQDTYRKTNSPQSMALLAAAEAVMAAAESRSKLNRMPKFKVLVISESSVFPVANDFKGYFRNASVEVDALDLSASGSADLKNLVSSPKEQHYLHTPHKIRDQQTVADRACDTLVKASSQLIVEPPIEPLFEVSKLLSMPRASDISYESQHYSYKADDAEQNKQLDGSIEADSGEYTWSPHPETEMNALDGDGQDTPEELFSSDDRKDICKYLREECSTHMRAGLCHDVTPQTRGMKKFCKTTCGFCS